MIEDRELDRWREEWGSFAVASSESGGEFQRKIQQRIRRQDRRFVIGNLLSAVMLVGMLIFAWFVRQQSGLVGSGWATGICVLVLVMIAYRIWALRGTWQTETKSTRAFVELWHRRAVARLRLLEVSRYISLGWLIFCGALFVIDWPTIGADVRARPGQWFGLLVICVVMQPVIWLGAAWLRRRKEAELDEVRKILDEMKE